MAPPGVKLRLPSPRPKAIDVAAALEQVGGDYDFVMTVMRDEFLSKARDQVNKCLDKSRAADSFGVTSSSSSLSSDESSAETSSRKEILKQIAFEAHSMKGSSATLHANPLSKACHVLEQTAKGVNGFSVDGKGITFVSLTTDIVNKLTELERDVGDLTAVTDVDVAMASETLGGEMFETLTRLAGNAVLLVTSPSIFSMVSSKCAEKFDKFRNAEIVNVKRLVKAVQVDATAVGAKALANAVGKFTDTLFSTGDSSTKESIVHSFVEARRCASIVAFDASAVVSSADVTDFTKAVEMCIAEEQGAVQYKNFTQHAGFTLTDGSGRGDAFDGSEQTALIEKCCFPVVKEMPEGVPVLDTLTSNDSSISSASPPSELAQPPMNFGSTVRALDGDVAFAETMLRAFLVASEKFAQSDLEKDVQKRRLSQEHQLEAVNLKETADWLGAPPLRAAIATLLDEDASEHAVRAARRAVRDLRVFADGLETSGQKYAPGGGEKFTQQGSGKSSVSSRSASPALLPKKSASTDDVMRSGLYAASGSGSQMGSGSEGDGDRFRPFDTSRASLGSDTSRRSSKDNRSSSDSGWYSVWRFHDDTEDGSHGSREYRHRRRGSGSLGGSSGRVSADSAGAAEGAVGALAALSPRARARGLAAIRAPRQKQGKLPFDVRKALIMADGNWDFAMGCAGRHAAAARDQVAVLKVVLLGDDERDFSTLNANGHASTRDDAKTIASGIAQLRSVAEGTSVSHAPRLMDVVEALAATLVSAASAHTSSASFDSSSHSNDMKKSDWRSKSKKLLKTLERRCEEYMRSVDNMASCSRAFSPRFVFTDLSNGDANVAMEKLRVFIFAAREAHVSAVRAVAAAESSFGSEALGGGFLETAEDRNSLSSSGGSSDDILSGSGVSDRKTKRTSSSRRSSLSSKSGKFSDEPGAHKKPKHDKHTFKKADIRENLTKAFGALEACERLASNLCARPSERAFRGAAARVARIAVEVSAAIAMGTAQNGNKFSTNKIPTCFLDDEHQNTVSALAALKREVEALLSDFHVLAPDVQVSYKSGLKHGKKNGSWLRKVLAGFVPEKWRAESYDLQSLSSNSGKVTRAFFQSLRSEDALVGAATTLITTYTCVRLFSVVA